MNSMKGDYEVFLMNKWRLWLISCFVILSLLFVRMINKDNSQDLAVYINGEHQNNIPKKGEALFQRAVCDNDVKASWNNDSWSLIINNLSQKTKCNLYFYQGQTVFNFDYTGDEQTFTVPVSGTYRIELWGASGGTYSEEYHGGYGGYTSGKILLGEKTNLYIYVGATNICKEGTDGKIDGAYNGGGAAGDTKWEKRYFCGGGGATDIRLVNEIWNSFLSLKSRIMVAGGGGGANFFTSSKWCAIGGNAGGLESYIAAKKNEDTAKINPSTQTSGYKLGIGRAESTSGGGGWYYGGYSDTWTGGAGGSSFISGHNGCDAIKEESTEDDIVHTGQSIHYSGLYFTNTLMIDGEGYRWTDKEEEQIGMPSHSDNSIIMGNSGNGYARITIVSIDE